MSSMMVKGTIKTLIIFNGGSTMQQENQKGQFNSNFGFLMAALGSAVGLGNLWSFPYKLGAYGGFAFLLVYAVLAVLVGYPLMLSEISIGRKTGRAAIEAYKEVKPSFMFNGVLQTIVPWLLICFYCTFGGFISKYLLESITALFSSKAVLNTGDPGALFGQTISSVGSSVGWMTAFLVLTMVIIFGGVSGGIEKFCNIAMPALFVMLVIVVIRSCTLPGAGPGLEFLFKPSFEQWSTAKGFFDVLGTAGGQMFFSLSLSSGCIIAYGSYLGKKENLEKNAAIITLGDSIVALLAGMAIMPAVFANGLEPGAGPGLLFVSMTAVFQAMGTIGKIFQLLFWLLVFFAALSSSIGMMEAGISAILDGRIKKGKSANRVQVAVIMSLFAWFGNFLTTADQLGGSKNAALVGFHNLFGQADVLSVWDCLAEGILMPFTGLIMAVLIGWFVPHYIDDEVTNGGERKFKSKGFYNFTLKWIGPLFMAMIVYDQISSFWGGK